MIDEKRYAQKLISKIFKVLPLVEENRENALKYLNSLIIELEGSLKYFDNSQNKDYFQSILFSLNGLHGVTDHNLVKSKVFECINLVNKIIGDANE